MPYRIAFVCSGNICRSPTAEAITRKLLADRGLADAVEVESFGIGDWHVGERMDRRAAAALRKRGYDIDHRARVIDAYDISERDLVVAIDRGHEQDLRALAWTVADAEKVRLLRSFEPAADGDLDIPDPYYGGASGFEHVLDLIETGCRGLVDEIAATLATR
jgi:protein-tyrosine phosphatase